MYWTQKHAIFPVIHVNGPIQARVNAAIAADSGADGVFLISHGDVSRRTLLDIAVDVSERDSRWVGVNLLGVHPAEIWRDLPASISGL